jgi:hypothetical protein
MLYYAYGGGCVCVCERVCLLCPFLFTVGMYINNNPPDVACFPFVLRDEAHSPPGFAECYNTHRALRASRPVGGVCYRNRGLWSWSLPLLLLRRCLCLQFAVCCLLCGCKWTSIYTHRPRYSHSTGTMALSVTTETRASRVSTPRTRISMLPAELSSGTFPECLLLLPFLALALALAVSGGAAATFLAREIGACQVNELFALPLPSPLGDVCTSLMVIQLSAAVPVSVSVPIPASLCK